MSRLILRSLCRFSAASNKQIPHSQNSSSINQHESPQNLAQEAAEQLRAYRQSLSQNHRSLSLNFDNNSDRVLLIDAEPNNRGSLLPKVTVGTLAFVSLYEILSGAYSYYHIVATIGVTGLVYLQSGLTLKSFYTPSNPSVSTLSLLNNDTYELTTSDLQTVTIPKNQLRLVGSVSTDALTPAYISYNNVRYDIPTNRVVNHVKLAELLQ